MTLFRSLFVVALMAGFVAGVSADATAKNHRSSKGGKQGMMKRGGGSGGKMGMRQASEPYDYFEAKGLFETGLVPVFPDGVACPEISSPYGSKTRYDGSSRNNAHHGYHNGMDISLDIGTPLLAVAKGAVISKGTAGQLVGNYLWLHFKPEDTGMPVHLFARYQHLDEVPDLSVGETVEAGQSVAKSGLTGTQGGHFGGDGYPHLHLVYRTGPGPEFTLKGPMIGPKSLNYLDPVGVYLASPPETLSNHALRGLPDAVKQVPIAAKTSAGIIPAGSRAVWPVACTSN